MKLSRDAWLSLGLLFLLVIVSAAAAYQQNSATEIPFFSDSPAPRGTLALKLWLIESKYQVFNDTAASYLPPPTARLALLLQPLTEITAAELNTLDAWVAAGGTLLVAGDSFPAETAFNHYHFNLYLLPDPSPPLAAGSPLLDSPPQTAPAPVEASFALAPARSDFVTHLAVDGRPVIVSFEQGRGRVILSSTVLPFSNRGLKESGNALLAMNLVSLSVERGGVWFDEWHHGVRASGIVGPGQWLRRTSLGRALLFIILVVFAALVAQGRGFGRPVPMPHETKRRGPLEHVAAIANLNRKAGHRGAVLRSYHQRLKRRIGQRYRLDPSLPDSEYVRQLGLYNPGLDQDKLLGLLRRLSQRQVGEAELLKLADEASKWMLDR